MSEAASQMDESIKAASEADFAETAADESKHTSSKDMIMKVIREKYPKYIAFIKEANVEEDRSVSITL